MAQPFQQRALNRKLIYTLCIVVLFTGSLIHRRFVIQEQAKQLLLREVDRGEVVLTGSAVRLLLTGSRGLAVTVLWNRVVGPGGAQEKHKHNEVELLVNSITELQPYFIRPWTFQSWNLAFNVSVECDRPRDKYYYITRGIERLAAGERRNAVPGNPDLRHLMGVYYQMKIGTSDEKMTMRSLLDLSCTDPVERDPNLLRSTGPRGPEINPDKFRKFCRDHPRLVRRLREQLGYNPKQVVDFLAENRELPGRFSDKKRLEGTSIPLDPIEQWPILPPKSRDRGWNDWPDPELADFGLQKESFDIFMASRTWHAYSQETLPPHDPQTGQYDASRMEPMKHRVPSRPTIIIFRNYPARAQVYMAETLQEEGWFDDKGWFLKDWFTDIDNPEIGWLIGDHPKFDSGVAWERGYKRYQEYGRENGMYLDPMEQRQLEAKAELFRKRFGVKPGEPANLPAGLRDPKLKEAFDAHQRLNNARGNRMLTNYDALLGESEAKSTPQAVAALKLFHIAEEWRKKAPPVTMVFYERNEQTNQYEEKTVPLLQVYDRAIELWLGVLLRFPNARQIQTLQEDTYEMQLKFIRYFQDEKADQLLRPLLRSLPMTLPVPGAVAMGQQHELYELIRDRWARLRDFRGPFDMTMAVYGLDNHDEQALKTYLFYWASGGNPYLTVHPHLRDFQLSFMAHRNQMFFGRWVHVISPGAVNVVRNRYRGLQLPTPEQPIPAQAPQP